MELTQKTIKGLERPQKGQKLVWDSKLPGFGLRLTPSKCVFIVQGRINGKDRRVTIASCETFSASEARKKARAYLQDMVNGVDPNGEKKKNKVKNVTLAEVAEQYIKDRELKQSSVRDIRRHLDYTFPAWKNRPIVKITRDGVLKLYRQRSEISKAQTNQAFRILRALLNYARATYRPGGEPILLENPVQVISDAKIWHNIKPRNSRVPLDKIGKVWNILEDMRQSPVQTVPSRSMVDAVGFALLTGARWGELQKLKWEHVNLEAGTWHIADPKNKNSVTLPLSKQAQAILENRPQLEGHSFVFCSDKSSSGYIGQGKSLTNQLSKELDTHITPHDLRRTFRSIAAETGIELWKTKLLMNHKIGEDITIQAYTEKEDLEYLRPAIQAIGDYVERQALHARHKVVEMPQRRHAM